VAVEAPVLGRYIDQIYQAAAAPDRWPAFLEALRGTLGAASITLVFYRDLGDGVVYSAGLHEPFLEAYRSGFYRSNPWQAFLPRLGEGEVHLCESVVPESELRRSEFYNQWMRPQGIAHPFLAILSHAGPAATVSYLSGFREEASGPFQPEGLELVQRLVPHLQQALVIHRRIQSAEIWAEAAEGALDRISGGVILLDERGAPIFTNRTADQILAAKDGLLLDPDGPAASASKQTEELRRVLAGAASTGAGKGEHAGALLRLARPSGRPALEVVVTPIRRGSSPLFDQRATAAIFVADPDAQAERSPERLRQLYGLTPTEAEVASRLARGMDAAEIGDDLDITIHTVRGHLKQLFTKTDTHRQADLVRVLLTGLADLRLE